MATILITGSNCGIGIALAGHCVARGDRVIATCRDPSALSALDGDMALKVLDITDHDIIDAVERGYAIRNTGLRSASTAASTASMKRFR